jgi:hypothetical protein
MAMLAAVFAGFFLGFFIIGIITDNDTDHHLWP